MLEQIFSDILQNTGTRVVSKPAGQRIYLDKNEQPTDIEETFKASVLNYLKDTKWNRYPPADNVEFETLIAHYAGLLPENITVTPGTAYIITALLNYFAINKKQIIINQPSYTLFDYHCKTYGINYEPWYLDESLEFNLGKLPELTAQSVIIIASPNNPVGNSITAEQLEHILQHKNQPLVILDAVYLEFSDLNFSHFLSKYNNLIILRSFSKAFPAAGIRLGYACATNHVTSMLRKLTLMFSINHFSRAYATVLLKNPEYMLKIENRIMALNTERDYLYLKLLEFTKNQKLLVKKSDGNFLLIKILDNDIFSHLLFILQKRGIHVLDTSRLPMLENTLRLSIGTHEENTVFLNYIKKILD